MKRLTVFVLIVSMGAMFADRVSSQAGQATIRGTVTDPEGAVYAGAFVSVSGGKTEVGNASGKDGTFTLQVPPGTYDLSVFVIGMKGYRRGGLVVQAGQTLVADVRLEDGPSLRTIGEDPETLTKIFIDRPDPPKGRTPRLGGGMPDLSGVWLSPPLSLAGIDMLPWAEALTKERADSNAKEYPPAHCLPMGPMALRAGGFFQLVHHQKTLVMLFENDTPGFRQVFLDGRAHPTDFGPTWSGHSTGRWQKDTLVIESIGFRDRGWLASEGHPHTGKLRVTHRLRRVDLGHLEIEIAIDDPGALEKPWKGTKTATLAPDQDMLEYVCNENNKAPVHMVGK